MKGFGNPNRSGKRLAKKTRSENNSPPAICGFLKTYCHYFGCSVLRRLRVKSLGLRKEDCSIVLNPLVEADWALCGFSAEIWSDIMDAE
jgi:hypothetical protein